MKKKSLKLLAVLTAVTVVAAGLTGCTGKIAKNNNSEIPSEEPSVTWEEPSEVIADPQTLLLEFAESNARAKVTTTRAYGLEKDKKYNLDELVEAMNQSLLNDWVDSGIQVQEVSYALIDCGNDGVPELALYVSSNNEAMVDELSDFYILRVDNGELTIVDAYEAYYRSYGTLNKYGVFALSGSSGASSGGLTYYRVNAAGAHEIIYGLDYEFGMAEAMIPGFRIPSETALPEGYPQYNDDYGNIEMDGYYFAESIGINENDTQSFDEYLANFVYVFLDNDQSVFPKEEYAKIYAEAGIEVTDQAGIEQIIESRLADLNMTKDQLTSPEENAAYAPGWIMVRDYIHTENQGG